MIEQIITMRDEQELSFGEIAERLGVGKGKVYNDYRKAKNKSQNTTADDQNNLMGEKQTNTKSFNIALDYLNDIIERLDRIEQKLGSTKQIGERYKRGRAKLVNDQMAEQIINFRQQGYSFNKIAEITGLSYGTVQKVMPGSVKITNKKINNNKKVDID